MAFFAFLASWREKNGRRSLTADSEDTEEQRNEQPLDKFLLHCVVLVFRYAMIEKTILETVISEMNNCFRETSDCFSKTRDAFAARLQSFILGTEKYLEAAIVGEIGNNTFDHNFGFITDCPNGVFVFSVRIRFLFNRETWYTIPRRGDFDRGMPGYY